MHRKALTCALSLLTAGLLVAPAVNAGPGPKDKGPDTVRVELTADNEVPIAISNAGGELVLTIDPAGTSIGYELTYEDLDGNVTQAHIHIGQKNVAGGIVLWLCQTAAAPAPAAQSGTPTCPAGHTGTITGT